MRVMKFGGTSVGDADCIKRAAEITARAARKGAIVAVVSAMGGVTNRLIEAAQRAAAGEEHAAFNLTSALRGQHVSAIDTLISDADVRATLTAEVERIIAEAAGLCRGTALLRELTPRALASISSAGERLSARLMAAALRELGTDAVAVEATELIVTDDHYAQAEPLMAETRERSRERLGELLAGHTVPVVTGFIGATSKGVLSTLGRGGSDYAATILGAALGAEEVIIWTDVDGILTADPRLVPEARTLREISYNEAAELAYFGAKVLHPKTLRPVTGAGIPVRIRNSFKPEHIGTKITRTGHPTRSGVKAITAISDVSLITVGGRGIVGVPYVVAKTFAATAAVSANVLLISQASSQNDICFIVDSRDAEPTLEALRRVFAFDLDHNRVEHITVNSEIAVVAVVGEKMRGTVGVSGRTFSAVGRARINVIAIAQGSSEYNISFVVEAADMGRAVAAVHQEFDLDGRAAVDGVKALTEVKG
ncbi:MAG: aspartate kinase [Pyrinomonadaceae bacterium]